MRKRGYLGGAAVALAWGAAACALSAAPGCGGSDAVSQAPVIQSPQEALKESMQYSQAQHDNKQKSKRSRARR